MGMFKKLEKISEGDFNQEFLATMHDSFRAIVKVFYWISVMKTYATAIEVATLSFLGAKGIAVPEVYGWFSTITIRPVSSILLWNMPLELGLIHTGVPLRKIKSMPW